jgi:hypothetical protein
MSLSKTLSVFLLAAVLSATTDTAAQHHPPVTTWCITTYAGNYASGPGYSGDGGLATSAQLDWPSAVVLGTGNLASQGLGDVGGVFISDTYNNVIRFVVASTGNIYTYAGDGTQGYSGDSGSAWLAELNHPEGIAISPSGNLYISDSGNHVVREVNLQYRMISTVAGTGAQGNSGNGGLATSATLGSPAGLTFDGNGNLYIADNYYNVIRRVDATTGDITLAVGDGTAGFAGDGGPASAAEIWGATGVASDTAGDLFIADSGNNRIREVSVSTNGLNNYQGTISTIAGNGTTGFNAPFPPLFLSAADVEFNLPSGIASVAGDPNPPQGYMIADNNNSAIEYWYSSGGTSGVGIAAGNRTAGYSGDGGAAYEAELNHPAALVQDPSSGFVYIADTFNNVIRKLYNGGCTAPWI